MHKSMWRMWTALKASSVGLTMAVAAATAINAQAPAEAGGPAVTKAAPAKPAVSAQWKRWVNSLVSWLKRTFIVRGVNFSGNGQFCTITMKQGKQSYVCEVNNFNYSIRAVP